MLLTSPLIITPRLLPGLKIADSFISIKHGGHKHGRYYYYYWIDIPQFSYGGRDLSSHKHDLQDALLSLLNFLSSAAEAYLGSEAFESFPEKISEWAYNHSDDIALLIHELEEKKGLITYQAD